MNGLVEGPAPVPASTVAPLLVIGTAPELTPDLVSVPVVQLGLERLPSELPASAALVFDLRDASVAELAGLRGHPQLTGLPLLLLSDEHIPDAAFTLLQAEDGVVLGVDGQGVLARRLALLLEVGRSRSRAASTITRGDACTLAESRAQVATLYRMLMDRQRFLHAVLHGVDLGVVTADEQGAVTFINRKAEQLLDVDGDTCGFPAEHLLGLPSSPKTMLVDEVRRVHTCVMVAQNGTERELDMSMGRAELSRYGAEGYFFVFRDAAAERKVEEERRRFERLAAMGTMVAGFAHEVRNPVAAMRSIVEELRDAGQNLEHVNRMIGMLERIERLVRTSLQFGRPAAPRRSPYRPRDIVTSALAELSPRLSKRGEKLSVDAAADLPLVLIDGQQLAQVLVILLHNALDATGSAARVVLRVRTGVSNGAASTPNVRFEVIDDGPGIPPENLGSIFDPFFTTKSTGTGLGLSIAQQLVSENGARLEVSSSPESGTLFAVVVTSEAQGS